MIKLAGAFFKRPQDSRADCRRHFGERHGPLVRSTEPFARHVAAYVQHDGLDLPPPEDPDGEPCGVSQIWFRSIEDLRKAFAEPIYMSRIRPDELRFVDLDRGLIIVGTEIAWGEWNLDVPIRLFRFMCAADDVGLEGLEAFRREVYAPALAADAEIRKVLVGHAQTFSVSQDDNPFAAAPTYDGQDEFSFRDVEDVTRFLAREREIWAETGGDARVRPGSRVEVITSTRTVM